MPFLRFLIMFTLVVWLGGILFFAFVLAPTVFAVLPTRNLAGMVVTRSLTLLHWIGLFSGLAYLAFSMIAAVWDTGWAQPLALRHVLVCIMLALVLISQLGIGAKMQRLRAEMGVIDNVAQDDARRVAFNRLHRWSTRTEGTILIMGIVVLFLTTRRLS